MRKKASSTQRASQAVPHPSADRALRRLTSEFGRDPVYSSRYGRRRTEIVANGNDHTSGVGFVHVGDDEQED